jgi:hypothetical protein
LIIFQTARRPAIILNPVDEALDPIAAFYTGAGHARAAIFPSERGTITDPIALADASAIG